MAVLSLASCVKKEEEVGNSLCAITKFNIHSITTKVPIENNGTVVYQNRVYMGTDVYFDIDQENLTIKNVDPLPHWVALDKVVPTYTSYGSVFIKYDSLYYTLNSGTDSVNLSNPVELAVVSTDGLYTKSYKLSLTKKASESDTVVWNQILSTDLQLSGEHRAMTMQAVYKDVTGTDSLVRRIMVFSNDGNGNPQVTSCTERSEATMWTMPAALTGASARININTIVSHQQKLYALDANGALYCTTEADKGVVWTHVADTPLKGLLCSDGIRLYGTDGTVILGSTDLIDWSKEMGSDKISMLPESSIFSGYSQSLTNSNMTVCVMGGLSSGNTKNAVTWYKNSSATALMDTPWIYIDVTADNPYGCPRLEGLSGFRYGDAMYVTGRKRQTDGTYTFAGFYRSQDHGISWHKQNTMWDKPKSLDPNAGTFSAVIVGNTVYMVQEGGNVWKGDIR